MSVLSFFEDVLGMELTVDNIRCLTEARHTIKWMEHLCEADSEFFSTYRPVPCKPSAVFDHQCYYSWPDGAELSADFIAKRVLNYLLYYPCVLISWNPNDFVARGSGLDYNEYLRFCVQRYLDKLMLLARLRPALLQGYVDFYHINPYERGQIDSTREILSFEHGLHFENNPGLALPDGKFFKVDGVSKDEASWAFDCIEALSDHLAAAQVLNGFPVVVDEVFRRLLDYHFQSVAANLSKVRLLTNAVPVFMDQIKLPSLIDNTVAELTAIRRDEELFESWRAALIDVFAAVQLEVGSNPLSGEEFQALSRDVLEAKRDLILKFVREKRWLRHAREDTIGFVLGMVGGLSVGGDIASTAISGLAGATLAMARSFYVSRREVKPGDVLIKWYSAFIEGGHERLA